MENYNVINKHVTAMNKQIGIYDIDLEKLSKQAVTSVIDGLMHGDNTDIDVLIRKNLHVVEVAYCDDEIDFRLYTQNEYIEKYGDERWDD